MIAEEVISRRQLVVAGAASIVLLASPTPLCAEEFSMAENRTSTVTLERRGHLLLIGINRPAVENRVDPPTFAGLGRAFFEYERDPSFRAAVLFGHGDHFCAGLDVAAFAPVIAAGQFDPNAPGTINPVQISAPKLSKPLVCVAHGNTFSWATSCCWQAT